LHREADTELRSLFFFLELSKVSKVSKVSRNCERVRSVRTMLTVSVTGVNVNERPFAAIFATFYE